MASDWIKMRVDLQSHPKVVRILSAVCPQTVRSSTDKFAVIGGLHAVWCVFDTHSSDGVLQGYTPELMNHVIGWPGFAEAMIAVGWLHWDGAETLAMPEFDEHNGNSAKRRAEDQKRKRDQRGVQKPSAACPQSVRNLSASDADQKRTRERDREEVNRTPLCTPPKEKKSKAVTLKTWLSELKGRGEKPVSDYRPLWEFADKVGLPAEFVELAWLKFRDRYEADEKGRRKRYTDWRRVFLNAVQDNWFRLWFWSEGDRAFRLTTAGVQQDKATLEAAA